MFSKYALILIREESREEERVCRLVRVSYAEGSTSYSRAIFTSAQELTEALIAVRSDGINTWFYENGRFAYDHVQDHWTWREHLENSWSQRVPKNFTYYSD